MQQLFPPNSGKSDPAALTLCTSEKELVKDGHWKTKAQHRMLSFPHTTL